VPMYDLKKFERVTLWPGASKTLEFTLESKDLELINAKGERVLESGSFKVFVGGSLPDERSQKLGASPVQMARFTVE
ncbi:MAG: fibronectin type III-like domain-contianing protein, partial [Bacteroidota bacterium]